MSRPTSCRGRRRRSARDSAKEVSFLAYVSASIRDFFYSGSLPCNVNVPGSYDRQFFEEARKKKEKQKAEYTTIDMESESLLEHDALNQNYEQTELEVIQARVPKVPLKYTSRATLEIGSYHFCSL